MTRASPVKHRVHAHRRSGGQVKVTEYTRGHGRHPPPPRPTHRGGWTAIADGAVVGHSDTLMGALELAERHAQTVIVARKVN